MQKKRRSKTQRFRHEDLQHDLQDDFANKSTEKVRKSHGRKPAPKDGRNTIATRLQHEAEKKATQPTGEKRRNHNDPWKTVLAGYPASAV